jgi:hypothetical protein
MGSIATLSTHFLWQEEYSYIFTEVWLVPLPHVLVVHSLALIIAHDLAKGPLLTRALKPAANDHA